MCLSYARRHSNVKAWIEQSPPSPVPPAAATRPPGGTVSYVGDLTYEDLSPIANFAFDALKSLDYSQMRIVMEGPLTGEIVTRVRFDGVRQGDAARSNFVTRRLAALPLQFRINVRAQFYQLLTNL